MNNLDFNFFCQKCQKSAEYRAANCFTKYKTKSYKRGDYIAFKGDRARYLSLIVSGSITISIPLASGVVVRSNIRNAPHPLGGLALFSEDNLYKADSIANEDCTVIMVAFEDIETQMTQCREFMRSFMKYTTLKIDLFIEQLAILSQRSIASKLAYYIFICSNDGRTYTFNRSIRELSDYLCVERPSLSRVISKFVEQGMITYHNGEGAILDINRLKELV